MPWLRRLARGLLAVVVGVPVAGVLTEIVLDATFPWRVPMDGERVDIGDGSLHLRCVGEGTPTVVLIHGLGGSAEQWRRVQDRLADLTRVCSYDRAGYGWSDSGRADARSERHAEDLDRLIDAAPLPTPLVVVGHSLGAFVARELRARRPDDVAAMVLVDGAHPSQLSPSCTPACLPRPMREPFFRLYEILPTAGRLGPLRLGVWTGVLPLLGDRGDLDGRTWRRLTESVLRHQALDTASAEAAAWSASADHVANLPGLGDLPLVVVHAEKPFGHSPGVDEADVTHAWETLQEDLANLSTRGQRVEVWGATHHSLLFDDHDAAPVELAVRHAVRTVRAARDEAP
ncbi:MAG: alpha/beta fold hydrolase [Alphaproteobacteria bacterium]|nr:alpha/beta fold hydrolase [Alphaproteobacteria bacterium]